jgi:hypothetical protein
MQWGCCKEIMTQCTLVGGFAPMRNSSFADRRVKAKAKVGADTTRHLDMVTYVFDNCMATEPHMALWAGLSITKARLNSASCSQARPTTATPRSAWTRWRRRSTPR